MIRIITICLFGLFATTGYVYADSIDDVSVRVFSESKIESTTFETTGPGDLLISEGDELIAQLPPGENAIVERWQGLLRVRWSRGSAPVSEVTLSSSGPILVTPEGRVGRSYRGSFHVALDGSTGSELLLVNQVDIEDYVASVLPAEYPFKEVEGAKAQAVVIRSYAVSAAQKGRSDYMLRDDIGSQVYRGLETETEFSRSVAHMTAGSVLLYDGHVVEAVYSSHCGGHSANNEDIWGTKPVPYLRGRNDPYDRDAPGAEWESEAKVSAVHDGLSQLLSQRVKGIKVDDVGKGDHVRTVTIDLDDRPDETISGDRFRSMVNRALGRPVILSSKFEIRKRSGEYRFKGRGNGHGVGLCQWGAAEQARQGRDYEDILTFYYRGVDISEADPEAFAFNDAPVPTESSERSTTPQEPEPKPKRSRRPGW